MVYNEWWLWGIFAIVITVMFCIDIFIVGGGKAHRVSVREATTWVIVWMTIAMLYAGLIWYFNMQTQTLEVANTKTLEFITGYLIEWSLSVDNLFVFILVFNYFNLQPEFQRRVLLYGILGAIFLRFVVIIFGVYLVAKFHWILYVFGILLIYSGLKIFIYSEDENDLSKNPILNWLRKHLKVTHELHGEDFFVKEKGVWHVTPLFIILVFIDIVDLIFALDSIPAIFAVTNDPFIICTSNTFAIIGLRAMYFLLARMHEIFHLLKHGVAFILIFIGIKMVIAYWYKIPILIALGVIISTLLICIILSIYLKKRI